MNLSFRSKLAVGALLGNALCASARAQNPNVVNDPTFAGQSPNFQAGGSISPDWTYTPNYLNFGQPWTLVSQTINTPGNLYIYDIDVQFAQPPIGQGLDFFVFWDGVPVANIFGSDGWVDHNYMVTAVGPTSEIGFVGNPTAWANLGSVDVSWSGLIDPPPDSGPVSAPDSPLGLALVAGVLGGICGIAALQRRREPALQRCRK
jgi:hypothetical protein